MAIRHEPSDVDKALLQAAETELRQLASGNLKENIQTQIEPESTFSKLYACFQSLGLVTQGWGYYRCMGMVLMRQRRQKPA